MFVSYFLILGAEQHGVIYIVRYLIADNIPM